MNDSDQAQANPDAPNPSAPHCAHAACKCVVPDERLGQNGHYCSDICAADADDSECSCGHGACDTTVLDEHSVKQSVISVGPES